MQKGGTTEGFINWANEMYRKKGIAFAIKIPVPVKVLTTVLMNLYNRKRRVITQGYFEEPAFLDYIGLYKGRGIAFDAKETKEDGFPLKNLKDHQYNYMKEWQQHGGISFLIVHFTSYNVIYRLDWTTLDWYWQQHKNKVRGFSQIPINEFEMNCKLIRPGQVCLDYLEGLEV